MSSVALSSSSHLVLLSEAILLRIVRSDTAEEHCCSGIHAMAITLTMREAFEQAEEEIWKYHKTIGFPPALTHHASGDVTRAMSLAPGLHEYDDMGNWSGSILMHFMMFKSKEDADDSILRIFDQTGRGKTMIARIFWKQF